jgi:serine/threonine-protein kinase HipA
MSDTLDVRFETTVVGRLRIDDTQRFVFAYDEAWLGRPDRFPVSLSIPLAPEEYVGAAAHNFFANLLPEGTVRQAVCARLGISADNDFALLQAIGGECAGALSLVDPARTHNEPDEPAYEELRGKRLQALVTDDIVPLLVGGATTRLSLAARRQSVAFTRRICAKPPDCPRHANTNEKAARHSRESSR